MGLGSRESTSPQQAADAAARALAQVKQGIDPREARDQERLEAGLKPVARRGPGATPAHPTTFHNVTRAFLADWAGSWKSQATELQFAKQMRNYAYPTMGDVPVDKLIIDHVEWSEIDFENRVWTIPAARMKSGREHRVPLSTEATSPVSGARTGEPKSPG